MSDVRHVLTIFAVGDLARATRFYRDAFGWELAVDAPSYAELAIPGGMRVGFYDRVGFARNIGVPPRAGASGAITTTEIYLSCVDLDAAIAQLVRAGGQMLSARAPRDWGDDVAYFADPDGNVIALAARH